MLAGKWSGHDWENVVGWIVIIEKICKKLRADGLRAKNLRKGTEDKWKCQLMLLPVL